MSKKIFWLAGENSGDIHSAKILQKLNSCHNDIYNFGIGGNNMKKQNFHPIFPFDKFAVMGFVEVLKHIFFFAKVYRKIKSIFKNNKPDLVILVDYPGFNMKIAKLANSFKIPVLYFISPQFWAWKQKRIFQLKKFTDEIAYILPFEGEFFQKENIKATYVGHPIAEEIEIKLSKKDFAEKHNLNLDKKWLGFFPGSRVNEIEKLLPIFYDSIKLFDSEKFEFLISKTSSISLSKFSTNKNVKIIENDNYEMMKYCNFLTITSGTATLETAFLGTPFIIVYKTSKISYKIGKQFIKIDKIGLPNIILNKIILPELIQNEVIGKNIFGKINEILNDKKKYNFIKTELKILHKILGDKSTSKEVTLIIEKMLYE